MATTVNIAFTGLCMFRKKGDSVVVQVPPTSAPNASHCGNALRPHAAMVVVAAKYLAGGGNVDTKVAFTARNLSLNGGGGPLDLPTHLASVSTLGHADLHQHPPGHVLATVTLAGGAFVDPNAGPDPLSGDWDDGSGTLKRFRWLANWSGSISATEIKLGTGADEVTLGSGGDPIDLAIVNIMPGDLAEWLKQSPTPTPVPLPGTEAVDFRWFFWMHDLGSDPNHCASQHVPILRVPGPHISGLPYTCLLGGE